MALSNIWNNSRRVIRDNLVVTYKKELKVATNFKNIVCPYWRYERRRTMSFDYVGLSRAGAEACAAAWNKALYRRVWKQEWIANESRPGDDAHYGFWSDAGRFENGKENQWNFIKAGTAKISHDKGSAWKVSVSIDETLPYNHAPFVDADGRRGTWDKFEQDPTQCFQEFRWGGEVLFWDADEPRSKSDVVHFDFNLDAIEYQFGLKEAKIVTFNDAPFVKVETISGIERDISSHEFRIEYSKDPESGYWTRGTAPSFFESGMFAVDPAVSPLYARLSCLQDLNLMDGEHLRVYSNYVKVQ